MADSVPEIFAKHGNDELVSCLVQYGAEFLVVGGTAVAVHGCRERFEVDDFDFMIDPTVDNAERVLGALQAARVFLSLDARSLAKPGRRLILKHHQFNAELLTPIEGVEFSDLRERTVLAKLGMHRIRVIGRLDLIEMKRKAVAAISRDLEKHQHDLACLTAS